jgi:hypothetical protein
MICALHSLADFSSRAVAIGFDTERLPMCICSELRRSKFPGFAWRSSRVALSMSGIGWLAFCVGSSLDASSKAL